MPHNLKTLFDSNPELRPLLKQVHALKTLQRLFISVAPPHLTQSSQALGLTQGILCIAVANAPIAAKLRQLTPELITLLRSKGCEVSGIRFKVQVSLARQQPASTPRKLNKAAIKTLDEFHQSLNDSPLKRTLSKMIQQKED